MSSQPHLRIFNCSPTTHDERSDFHLFPLLPKELRLKIWRHTLQRRRIIHLRLNNQRGQTPSEAGENPESTSNGERYFTVVDGSKILSKLLRVSRESREEALMFCRVHLPCRFTGGGTGMSRRAMVFFASILSGTSFTSAQNGQRKILSLVSCII